MTIEATSKQFKGLMALGAVITIAGLIVMMTASVPIGAVVAFVGVAMYLMAKASAWWDNG